MQALRHARLVEDAALAALAVTGRAELDIARGALDVAARELDRASELAVQAGDQIGIAEIGRVRALMALHGNDAGTALDEARAAGTMAESQDRRSGGGVRRRGGTGTAASRATEGSGRRTGEGGGRVCAAGCCGTASVSAGNGTASIVGGLSVARDEFTHQQCQRHRQDRPTGPNTHPQNSSEKNISTKFISKPCLMKSRADDVVVDEADDT